MSRPARKPTLWTLRKVSTRISLNMPRRLTRADTFCLLWIFCFRNHYSIPLSPRNGMCRPGLACAYCIVSIHFADTIMLVFSRNGSKKIILFNIVYNIAHLSSLNRRKIGINHRFSDYYSNSTPIYDIVYIHLPKNNNVEFI